MDTGVLFLVELYAVRAGDEEDFEEITLCGSLGDDPDSQITIQYLLSTSNPIIDCHLFLSGPVAESIRHLEFPAGIEFPLSPSNHLYLPLDLSLLRSLEECGPQLPLWEPVDKENHQVYGSPFVILTKTETEEKSAAAVRHMVRNEISHISRTHACPIDRGRGMGHRKAKFRMNTFQRI